MLEWGLYCDAHNEMTNILLKAYVAGRGYAPSDTDWETICLQADQLMEARAAYQARRLEKASADGLLDEGEADAEASDDAGDEGADAEVLP